MFINKNKQDKKQTTKSSPSSAAPQNIMESVIHKMEKQSRLVSGMATLMVFVLLLSAGLATYGFRAQSAIKHQSRAVLVATKDLPAYTKLTPENTTLRDALIDTAPMDSLTQLTLGDETRAPMAANQIIRKSDLVRLGASPTLTQAIRPGYTAVSITGDETMLLSPMLQIGNHIKIIALGDNNHQSSVIAESAVIIAIDGQFTGVGGKDYKIITVELTAQEAERFSSANNKIRIEALSEHDAPTETRPTLGDQLAKEEQEAGAGKQEQQQQQQPNAKAQDGLAIQQPNEALQENEQEQLNVSEQ